MSDGTLSQDEIDALLQGTDQLMTESLGQTNVGGYTGGKSVSAESLSDADKANLGDLLREIGHAQSSALSTMTQVGFVFSSPFIDSGQIDVLKRDVKGKVIQAKINLTGGINGEWVYVVPEKSVLTITNILIGQAENTEITDLVKSTFGEVISQISSAMINVLGEKLGKQINLSSPQVDLLNDTSTVNVTGGQYVVRLNYNFTVQDKGSTKFYSFFTIPFARSLSSAIVASKAGISQQIQASSQTQQGINIRPVGFEPLQVGVASESMGNIALLLDVPMRVTVELGRTKMMIREILSLGEGSIIELDKLAGEPVDILVNDKLIAQGEVVVIDENFAVRVTKIVTPVERIFENPAETKY